MILVMLLFLVLSPALFAGDIEITVIDGDLSIPLEGARIVSWDGSEIVCDSEGKALLSVPDERTVTIRASYPGYEPGRLAVGPGVASYTLALHLGGRVMEERELVIEAARPGSSETVSGRSVAISGGELRRSAERGIVEDVMSAVKLLPGVGYVGGYMAMPSIRGGEPQDITAVFDGFYVERPYHWGGAFSIFDPKMVASAQLSHGVFSARYGHTVSGLLNIRSKEPSRDTAELDLAVSTSAANLNLSFPLGGKGGVSLMGKTTYWDPFVALAKNFFEEVRYISTAPYIRSAALGASYDFSTDLHFSLNGFFGFDGVGASYDEKDSGSSYDADFFWDNKIGFVTSGLAWSPRSDLLLNFRLGTGLITSDLDGKIDSIKYNPFSEEHRTMYLSDRTANVQGRFDLDWDRGGGLIISAGLEERYSRWDRRQYARWPYTPEGAPAGTDKVTIEFEGDVLNQGLSSAAYTLLEYKPEGRRFGMELGLRGDHFFLSGEDITLKGIPAVNPRINLDFLVLEERGPVDALTLTAGSGLFSSVNSVLQSAGGKNNIGEYGATQNRSWTTLGGTRIDFIRGFTFTLEGYFKYVFRRAYTENDTDETGAVHRRETNYYFDGKAIIWGFDCMLQKFESRHWDGWVSYSYINAKYRDPHSTGRSKNSGGWYYPSFHRFHTLNLILNYKPVPAVQLTTRFSLASGIPMAETVAIVPDPDDPGSSPPYERIQAYSDYSRTGLVIPLDIKLSFFKFNEKGKVRREIYLNFENLLALAYTAEGPKDFDENTGREVPGTSVTSYDLPIPLLTFGMKWSY
ncbi:MAG: TonB-dependent receptor plug domain-containing protein [Treponema sp.]|jgi:hypothetical protein|nr:TonB-dependent receptor plug domain-containing protein [Treponema sp.]